MYRREAFAVVLAAAGLGSCQSMGLRPSSSPEVSDDTSAYETELSRRVTVIHQDSVPDRYKLNIEAEMVEQVVTPDQPARLRVTTTNLGEARRINVNRRDDGCVLFWQENSVSDPNGLWLRGPDTVDDSARPADKWTALSPGEWGLPGCVYNELSTGESVSNEYLVWDDADADGYLSPDMYRFEGYVVTKDHTIRFPWGVTIQVEGAVE